MTTSMTDRAPRRWLITGVSSGLGRALAEYVLELGDIVIGTLRQESQLAAFAALASGRAFPVQLDVTDDEAVQPALAQVIDAVGGLDVVVNNAGYALIGAIEDATLAEARLQMETNLFGALKIIRTAIPYLRARDGGRIINIASVAGSMGMPIYGHYCASKFALVGLSAALAQELAPFNIRVTVLEPGGFRTNFGSSSLRVTANPSPLYEERTLGMAKRMADFGRMAENDPRKGAAAIVALSEMADPPVHAAMGTDGLKYVRAALAARLADYERAEPLLSATAADPR